MQMFSSEINTQDQWSQLPCHWWIRSHATHVTWWGSIDSAEMIKSDVCHKWCVGGMGCYATMHYGSNDTSKSKQVINEFDSRPSSDMHAATSHDRIVAVSLCLCYHRDLFLRGEHFLKCPTQRRRYSLYFVPHTSLLARQLRESTELTASLLGFSLVKTVNIHSVRSTGMFAGRNYKLYTKIHATQIIYKKGNWSQFEQSNL
jgi:hypothetical protein